MYKLFHKHELSIQPVYFSIHTLHLEQLKDLIIYIQFKAEQRISSDVVLNGPEILGYLKRFGAKMLSHEPDNYIEIDLYQGRVDRLGEWKNETFNKLDETYGVKANIYIEKLDRPQLY